MTRGIGLAVAWLALIGCIVFLLAPLVVTVGVSLSPSPVFQLPQGEISWRWYERLSRLDGLLDSVLLSLQIAAFATAVSLVLGTMAAIAVLGGLVALWSLWRGLRGWLWRGLAGLVMAGAGCRRRPRRVGRGGRGRAAGDRGGLALTVHARAGAAGVRPSGRSLRPTGPAARQGRRGAAWRPTRRSTRRGGRATRASCRRT